MLSDKVVYNASTVLYSLQSAWQYKERAEGETVQRKIEVLGSEAESAIQTLASSILYCRRHRSQRALSRPFCRRKYLSLWCPPTVTA